MKKKIIYSLLFCTFLFTIITSFSFATNNTQVQNDMNNMQNRVDNTMDNTGNRIENGFRTIGNTVGNGAVTVGNTIQNGATMVGNGITDAGESVRNTAGAAVNETAINPANQGNTFLGLTSRAWMWIIVIAIIIIIISLIVKYANNDDSHNKD